MPFESEVRFKVNYKKKCICILLSTYFSQSVVMLKPIVIVMRKEHTSVQKYQGHRLFLKHSQTFFGALSATTFSLLNKGWHLSSVLHISSTFEMKFYGIT